jgi:pentatricopeptide repeat protein
MQDDHGIQPTHVTFNCLINGYAKAGGTAKAEKWFDAMMQADMKPRALTFRCMIRAFSAQGRVEQAMSCFSMAQSQCNMMDVDVTTYMIVMRMCAREGLDDELEACHDKLKCAGLDCARHVFRAVISGYADARELDKVKTWCSRAKEAGFEPKLNEYTQLLRACGPKESQPANPDQGREVFLMQIAEGIAPDSANLEALTDALGQRAYNRLCQELHVHTRAAHLNWWPDSRNISKPMRLARQILSLSFSSDVAHGEL